MEVKQTGFHDLKIFVIQCLCCGKEKRKKTFEIDPTPKLSRKYAPYILLRKIHFWDLVLLKLQIQIDCQMSKSYTAFISKELIGIYNFLKDRKQKHYFY